MPTLFRPLQAGRTRQPPCAPVAWPLGVGQSEWLQVPRGARVCLHEGRLRLHEPPLWLAEGFWQPVQALHAGEVHTVQRPGWLRLEGQARCMVSVQQPPSYGLCLRLWARWAMSLARGLGRRWPPVAENS